MDNIGQVVDKTMTGLQKFAPKQQEVVGPAMSANGLSLALEEETKKRQVMQGYIQNNLVEGTDFGKIKMGNGYSKPTLFKSGAEKICSLLHLKPTFRLDHDLVNLHKNEAVAYVCELINRHTGEIEGEGRGACGLKEKGGNFNTAVKIAEKRAQMDAVLRVAALSDQFTQDLEDIGAQVVPASKPVTPQISTTSTPKSELSPPKDDIPEWDEPSQQREEPEELTISTHCTFGKNKGQSWVSMGANQLEWYKKMFEDSINDPSKSKYIENNNRGLRAVMNVLLDREETK